jgi:dihydroflavonol-4-reductase
LDKLAGKKRMILLTGGTGFLGKYILDELLSQGQRVRMLVRNPDKVQPRAGVEMMEGDILDILSIERAMEGVTQVIHAAAVVSFWKRRQAEMQEVNVTGTSNMVDAALEAKVDKFLHVSSVAALGRTGSKESIIDEQCRWIKSPINTRYGRSKYLSELQVYRGVEEGLPAVICNPGVILGPGHWDLGSPNLFDKVAKGMKFYNPGTTGVVSAVDVARACRLLLESKFVQGDRFILVSESMPYKMMFDLMAQGLGVAAPNSVPPVWLTKVIAAISALKAGITNQEPLITGESLRLSRGHCIYDASKITRELPFAYGDIRAVIAETCKIYLQDHNSGTSHAH